MLSYLFQDRCSPRLSRVNERKWRLMDDENKRRIKLTLTQIFKQYPNLDLNSRWLSSLTGLTTLRWTFFEYHYRYIYILNNELFDNHGTLLDKHLISCFFHCFRQIMFDLLSFGHFVDLLINIIWIAKKWIMICIL